MTCLWCFWARALDLWARFECSVPQHPFWFPDGLTGQIWHSLRPCFLFVNTSWTLYYIINCWFVVRCMSFVALQCIRYVNILGTLAQLSPMTKGNLRLPSGRRFRGIKTKTLRHLKSFFPTAVGLTNKPPASHWLWVTPHPPSHTHIHIHTNAPQRKLFIYRTALC